MIMKLPEWIQGISILFEITSVFLLKRMSAFLKYKYTAIS